MCGSGWHCVDEDHILRWLGAIIYEVEFRGEVEQEEKICAHEMRLLRQCAGWNERTARLLACDCAERALPLFEKAYPEDQRPRQAVETARLFADGGATLEQLTAARDAARAAVENATREARWAAVWAAAWAAMWAAAEDAAGAAENAAMNATWAAAGAGAWDAAWDTTWETGWAAAGAAARKWQNEKLLELLR
jgi:hypothetical protein